MIQPTLRVRLTAWYVLLLGSTLILFSGYLYLHFKISLRIQLDTNLELTASQTLNNLVDNAGHPAFKKTLQSQALATRLAHSGFAIRLMSPQGNIWDGFGDYQHIPNPIPQKIGYVTLTAKEGKWRVYNYSLADTPGGWLQVAQSLDPISKATEHLLILMFLGFPIVLIVAALGGLFLANQALSPIDKIIRTAETIRSDDFTRRIHYQGSLDEVGRLAMTLDRMLDRIEAAFDHERQFIADASHELRTPLTVIKGRIEVTLSRLRSVEEYTTTLQALEQEVDRLIRLANGLLFLARLDQEDASAWVSLPMNLSILLETLVEQILPLAEAKEIKVIETICPNLSILGNADYLTSVFLNLLDNAIKYTPDQGQITIDTLQTLTFLETAISNTGPGIDPEHLPHLFDRFYRVEGSRSSHRGGAGLGLAIAYEIIRLHQGTLTVESNPDKITRFTVRFPLLPNPH